MRTVLITGTSTGFGLVTAVELAKRGWRVFATMRNLAKKGPLEAALEKAGVRLERRDRPTRRDRPRLRRRLRLAHA